MPSVQNTLSKQFLRCDELISVITDFINTSLISGVVPVFQARPRETIAEKSNLDPELLKNDRQVSNLPFLSKVVESVLVQLMTHIETHNFTEPFNSIQIKKL